MKFVLLFYMFPYGGRWLPMVKGMTSQEDTKEKESRASRCSCFYSLCTYVSGLRELPRRPKQPVELPQRMPRLTVH